jgi:hypothetical protein
MKTHIGERGRVVRLGLGVVALGALAAAACQVQQPGSQGPSSSPNQGPQFLAWTGVKGVADTLSAKAADAATPVVLGEGLDGAVYVQWGAGGTTFLTRFASTGLSQKLARSRSGKGGHSVAVPTCGYQGKTQDCPMLAVGVAATSFQQSAPAGAPEVVVMDCAGMQSSTNGGSMWDFSPGSSLGALIPAGGTRMFLAEKFNAWTTTNPPMAGPNNDLAVSPVRVDNHCVFAYAESELYSGTSGTVNDDGYSKGRLLSLGLPAGFTVTAAARLGTDGMLVAGGRGATGKPWVVSLDQHFALAHQSDVPVGGALARTSAASVTVDRSRNVFVCGTSRSLVVPKQGAPEPPPEGWLAQAAPDLTGWQVQLLPGVTVAGCAVSPGGVIVSGSYTGMINGLASNGGSDIFLGRLTPGAKGGPPALAASSHAGSAGDEVDVSPPLITAGGLLFVGGITHGNWGAAKGTSTAKVFAARFDPVSLALK